MQCRAMRAIVNLTNDSNAGIEMLLKEDACKKIVSALRRPEFVADANVGGVGVGMPMWVGLEWGCQCGWGWSGMPT